MALRCDYDQCHRSSPQYYKSKTVPEKDYFSIRDVYYEIACAKGYRIGCISSSRRITIRCIKIKLGKPGKRLLHKINHEVDCRILDKIISLVLNQYITLGVLEDTYDNITPQKEELGEDCNGDDGQ